MDDKFDSTYLDRNSYWMHVPSQTEQSRAEQSCLVDLTFDESVHGEVGKVVGKIVGMTVGMTVGKVVGITVGKAVGQAVGMA